MKKITFFLLFTLISYWSLDAQHINWRSFQDPFRHQITASFGADYTSNYGISYAYKVDGRISFAPGIALSLPFGNQAFDDWRIKLTLPAEIWHSDHFSWGLKPGMVLRRYQSDAATLFNTGAGLSTTFGYLKRKWGIVIEGEYEASLATHITNEGLKEYYPQIQDGWYGASGGNFKFGLGANYTLGSWAILLTVGKTYAQDFKDNPSLPFFFDISIQKYL